MTGIWRCAECGKEAKATVHQMRQTYCSRACMAVAFTRSMVGGANPNFRKAGQHVCAQCGSEFQSYNKGRKYCSKRCHADATRLKDVACAQCRQPFKPQTASQRYCTQKCARDAVRKERPPRTPRVPSLRSCLQCGKAFQASPSSHRKYCSYPCHLASGGAQRAGEASVRAKKVYGGKKDANHDEVFAVISALVPVFDLSGQGFGVPDGVAFTKSGWQLFDVKNPKTTYGRKGLNPIQAKWAKLWLGSPVFLIHDTDEALRFARGDFSGLTAIGGGSIVTVEHLRAARNDE